MMGRVFYVIIDRMKKKILYLITQSSWGGAQKYVFDLAIGFQDKFEVVVACGGNGELIKKLQAKNVQVFPLKYLVRKIRPVKDFLGFWEIYFLIRKEKPDVVHTNSSKAEILGNIAAWLARFAEFRRARVPKIVFTAHGFVFNEEMIFLKKTFFVFWEKLASLFADKIICVSEFDRQKGIENKIAQEKKFVTIHNGIEISGDISHKISKEKIVVGTVANFYRNKSLETFIQAAGILHDRGIENVEFQIVGDGAERSFLESEIERLQLEDFRLLGFQKNGLECMKEFDVFVLSSIKEGFPYVILEAMSLGLPIVATKVGGVPEVVVDGQNGFLVEPKNAEELADKIEDLIRDPEKRRYFGNHNQEKIRQRFSFFEMRKKVEKIYLV